VLEALVEFDMGLALARQAITRIALDIRKTGISYLFTSVSELRLCRFGSCQLKVARTDHRASLSGSSLLGLLLVLACHCEVDMCETTESRF
jgi:hypothetical protein